VRSRMLLLGALFPALVLLVACDSDESDVSPNQSIRDVDVDGGTVEVVLVGSKTVQARPGDTIRIHHKGGLDPEEEVAVTHAFVSSPPDELPSAFVGGAGGVMPNPAVWGACSGGEPSPTVTSCPMLSDDAPSRWDGRSYWSLGASVPGEERDLPLADDIAEGTYTFVCALHPRLRVDIEVTSSPEPVSPDPLPDVDAIANQTPALESGRHVAAGFQVKDPPASVNLFSPAEVTITEGEEVTWSVDSRDPHDVVFGENVVELVDSSATESVSNAPRGAWDGAGDIWSGFLSTDPSVPEGAAFSLTFGAAGRYPYQCRFHPNMTGLVVVEPALR
jgi:plastocyanin